MIEMLHPAARTYAGIPGYVFGWLAFSVAVLFFAHVMRKRYILLKAGRADPRLEKIWERLKGFFVFGILQRRQPRYLWAGIIHIVIFWGFVVLGLRSIDLLTQALGMPVLGLLMDRSAEAFYGLMRDIAEICVLVACLWAMGRRFIARPKRYEGSSHTEAYIVLGLISFLMITDIGYDAIGLVIEGGNGDNFAPASGFASLFFQETGPSFLRSGHALAFWLHILAFLFFLCFLPMGKHFHIITALPNVFLRRLAKGSVKPVRWDVQDLEEIEKIGVSRIEDFTWKQLLDLFTCTECGRCTDRCPAFSAGRPLSPKSLTMKLRDHAYGMFPLFGRSPAAGDKEDADEEERREIFGNILTEEEIWSCTTCGACEEECPVFIEYIDKIIDMRRNLIETSNAPRAFNQVFMHLEKTGNPFGKPPSKRSAWASELEGMSVRVLKEGDETDILYYVDSYPSYDPRAQSVAAAVVRTLNLAGVEFGILGPKEKDSGHQVRRMGEEGLFQLLMEENMETLKGIKFKKIVTTDPHAYNTLRNDYSIKFQVLHYSMLMNSLMEQGLLKPKRDVEPGIYTYHDPCYLGRHNGIYDEPRRLLKSLPGLKLVEMERSRDRSFCCGGGDIILWHEISSEKERPAGIRINMARKAGAGVIVTSCPFCLMHFEDAIKTAGLEWELKVVDLAELVVSTL